MKIVDFIKDRKKLVTVLGILVAVAVGSVYAIRKSRQKYHGIDDVEESKEPEEMTADDTDGKIVMNNGIINTEGAININSGLSNEIDRDINKNAEKNVNNDTNGDFLDNIAGGIKIIKDIMSNSNNIHDIGFEIPDINFEIGTIGEKKKENSKTDLVLDLKSMLGLALAKNESIRMAKLKLDMAGYESNIGYAEYFMPSLDAEIDYTNSMKNYDYYGKTENLSQSNKLSAKLSGSMNIFSFGRDYYSFKALKANERVTEYDTVINENNVILKLLKSYYNLLILQENERISAEMLNFKKSVMELAELKYKLGMVSFTDKLSSDNAYSDGRVSYEKAKNSTKKKQMELNVLMGLRATAEFDMEDFKQEPEKLVFNIEDLKKIALENRIEYKKLVETENVLEYDIKNLKASRYPSIDLSAKTGTGKDLSAKNSEFINNSKISVDVSVPIFNGFSVTNNIKSKEKELESCKLEIEVERKNIEKEVLSAYYDFVVNQEKFFLTKEILNASIEKTRIILGKYKVGKASMIELLKAQANLESSKKNFIESKYNWFILRASLLSSIGKLDLTNIININGF